MTLDRELNRLFRAPDRRKRPASTIGYDVQEPNGYRSAIIRRNGLWTVTVRGVVYSNSILADLGSQLWDAHGAEIIKRKVTK